MEELRFATENEAIQYLAELTGKKIRVAMNDPDYGRFRYIHVTPLSYEEGKFYSEGQYDYDAYSSARDAFKYAEDLVGEEYDVVVWSEDYLLAYGGPHLNEEKAMRYGTGKAKRLTKKFHVRKIS